MFEGVRGWHIVIAGIILLLIAIILFAVSAPVYWGIIFLLISLGIIAAGSYKYIKHER